MWVNMALAAIRLAVFLDLAEPVDGRNYGPKSEGSWLKGCVKINKYKHPTHSGGLGGNTKLINSIQVYQGHKKPQE